MSSGAIFQKKYVNFNKELWMITYKEIRNKEQFDCIENTQSVIKGLDSRNIFSSKLLKQNKIDQIYFTKNDSVNV